MMIIVFEGGDDFLNDDVDSVGGCVVDAGCCRIGGDAGSGPVTVIIVVVVVVVVVVAVVVLVVVIVVVGSGYFSPLKNIVTLLL